MATADELAQLINGTVQGDGAAVVTGVASVEDAVAGDIVLAEDEHYFEAAINSDASVIVCSCGHKTEKTTICVENCRLAFIKILEYFAPKFNRETGIDPSCRVGEQLVCGNNVTIGYGCYIGSDVTIGDDVIIGPQSYIGDQVHIGAGSVLDPCVTVHWGTEIGERVSIHSGTVVGTDGFGYIRDGVTHKKVPQIGRVVIENDVEIGANVTIDRAKTGATRIGSGTKIDNLVMIAHNVKIGKNCIIVAQTGISGSTVVGDGAIMAGQSGVKDHIKIGENAVITSRCGVIRDVPPGAIMAGYPARERKQQWRIEASLDRLPDLIKKVHVLEKDRQQERK